MGSKFFFNFFIEHLMFANQDGAQKELKLEIVKLDVVVWWLYSFGRLFTLFVGKEN